LPDIAMRHERGSRFIKRFNGVDSGAV
jgi:hypothetical protein